ncbi:MAG: hypothetical protein HY720_26425 [Planctomycetes bacterium]|nr:hypothetical protein [Planctomycetota bacterium]
MKKGNWTQLSLCGLVLAAAGCGDEILRRGEDLEVPPSRDVAVTVKPEGHDPANVEVEAATSAVIWFNHTQGKNITILVKGATLLAGVAANRNMMQHGADVVTDRMIPPGGLASAKFAQPGRFAYEIHGLGTPVTGTITVRPGPVTAGGEKRP